MADDSKPVACGACGRAPAEWNWCRGGAHLVCGCGDKIGTQQEAERVASVLGWTLTRDELGVWRVKSPAGGGESCPNLKPILARLKAELDRRPRALTGGPW